MAALAIGPISSPQLSGVLLLSEKRSRVGTAMPKTSNNNQIPLIPSDDDVARATRKSTDEQDWERERTRRNRKKKAPNPVPATGPCCARCEHWRDPGNVVDFGTCGIRVVTVQRIPNLIEKGMCLEYRWDGMLMIGPDLPLGFDVATEAMHTKGAFSCQSFVGARRGREAA